MSLMADTLTEDEFSRIKEIVDKRLILVPTETKVGFPRVLHEPHVSYLAFATRNYFMLAMLDDREKVRVTELNSKGFHPFPGLVAEEGGYPTAFSLRDSRNILLMGNTVSNLVGLSLGKDCSVLLIDHHQEITTEQLGVYKYTVQLAYVLSFGTLITRGSMIEYLEELIDYSINTWHPSSSR